MRQCFCVKHRGARALARHVKEAKQYSKEYWDVYEESAESKAVKLMSDSESKAVSLAAAAEDAEEEDVVEASGVAPPAELEHDELDDADVSTDEVIFSLYGLNLRILIQRRV